MKKYATTIRVLVTLRVKESPTAESGAPEWTAGTGNQVARTRDAVAFVRDAVASWGGQAPPDYVFFPTNLEVTAKRAAEAERGAPLASRSTGLGQAPEEARMTKLAWHRPDPLNLGFTGTQRGATVKQLRTLFWLLTEDVLRLPDRFHLGDCVGADEQAAHLAYALGIDCVGHPPIGDHRKRAFFKRYLASYEPLPYLARNRELVDVCDALVACPRTANEELRSGTWATVRYALKRKKLVQLITPDGRVKKLP